MVPLPPHALPSHIHPRCFPTDLLGQRIGALSDYQHVRLDMAGDVWLFPAAASERWPVRLAGPDLQPEKPSSSFGLVTRFHRRYLPRTVLTDYLIGYVDADDCPKMPTEIYPGKTGDLFVYWYTGHMHWYTIPFMADDQPIPENGWPGMWPYPAMLFPVGLRCHALRDELSTFHPDTFIAPTPAGELWALTGPSTWTLAASFAADHIGYTVGNFNFSPFRGLRARQLLSDLADIKDKQATVYMQIDGDLLPRLSPDLRHTDVRIPPVIHFPHQPDAIHRHKGWQPSCDYSPASWVASLATDANSGTGCSWL